MSGDGDRDGAGDDASAADVLRELRTALTGLAGDFKDAFEKVQEETQYRLDKELGRRLAKHPEVYAELRRGYRQFRKGFDKMAREWGLR